MPAPQDYTFPPAPPLGTTPVGEYYVATIPDKDPLVVFSMLVNLQDWAVIVLFQAFYSHVICFEDLVAAREKIDKRIKKKAEVEKAKEDELMKLKKKEEEKKKQQEKDKEEERIKEERKRLQDNVDK